MEIDDRRIAAFSDLKTGADSRPPFLGESVPRLYNQGFVNGRMAYKQRSVGCLHQHIELEIGPPGMEGFYKGDRENRVSQRSQTNDEKALGALQCPA